MQQQIPNENQLLAQCQELIRSNNIQAAVNACQLMNRHYPQNADGWFVSSFLALKLGGHDHALQTVERALSLHPGVPHWILHRASCLQATGRLEDAIKSVNELAKSDTQDDALLGEIGLFASRLEQHELALKMFQKAVEQNPAQGRHYFNLATALRFKGELDKAESACEKAIELNPDDHDARFLRSGLRKQTSDRNHVDELETTLSGIGSDPMAESLVSYSLAKELEDLGESERSFAALQRGASARRSSLAYSPEEDIGFINTITEVYNAEFMASDRGGYDNNEAIFVLGLPRTGTTLVERILGSHDSVLSAGELTNFTRAIAGMAQTAAQQNPAMASNSRDDMVRLTAGIDFTRLGQMYVDSTRPLTGKSPRFIDKFPQNTLNMGPIRLALPKARMVLLQRHPMDSCYSMYKQIFTNIYQFSYDLEELGRYFIAHQRLLDHWLAVAGDAIHVIQYEKLVTDPEVEVRGLLEFCSLPWQDQCLDFHKNKQASTTASASQVRQKLYTSSIGKWKDYEQQLEPLRVILDKAGMLPEA